MEILELFLGLFEGCGCLLELAALLSNTAAAASGAAYAKKRRQSRQKGAPAPGLERWSTFFWVTLAVGLMLTTFAIAKYALRK